MVEKPYSDYYSYLRREMGAVTYKVSVDGGFTCPNIDGTVAQGGCTYCNNRSFIPKFLNRRSSIYRQLDEGVESQRKRYDSKRFIAYFQAYSNTYDSVDQLQQRYEEALGHPDIDGLVVGTRADCLPDPVIDLLAGYAHKYYVAVEVGIESVYDETLRRINRGHDFAAVRDVFDRLQGRGLHLGAHFILGFPWETRQQWEDTAGVVSELPLDYLKLHHLQVVSGTAMAKAYKSEPFSLFGFDEWVDLVCDFLELLPPDLAIARLCGSAPPHMLIAPKWGRKKHPEVISRVMEEMDRRGTRQGARYTSTETDASN